MLNLDYFERLSLFDSIHVRKNHASSPLLASQALFIDLEGVEAHPPRAPVVKTQGERA